VIGVPANEFAQAFLQEKLGVLPSADFRGAVFAKSAQPAITKDDAGVVVGWHGFTGKTCNISIVVQKPECLTRWVIDQIFRFPFVYCGCVAIIVTVDSNNLKSLELARRTGFKEIYTVKAGGRTGDLVCLILYKQDCRWLRKD
jgi:hypothetical protein